jgi:hypothetical protein
MQQAGEGETGAQRSSRKAGVLARRQQPQSALRDQLGVREVQSRETGAEFCSEGQAEERHPRRGTANAVLAVAKGKAYR